MGRWSKEEIEAAFDKFQAAALTAAKTCDWTEWANCFTEDCAYVEHHYGKMRGRDRILNWITETMKPYTFWHMKAFPMAWYSIGADRGWVYCEVRNRMEDLGDGEIYEEPNITILHYGGNGMFKCTKKTPITQPIWAQ
ncbi:MAG: nuclear transport factor 2 family protein [Pseudomonadales bacterium]